MLLASLPGLCFAQNESATLSGQVTDPAGAAIVGAEVVLTNVDTNVEQRTKTNTAGLYVFTGVHPGAYRVAAGSPGFKTLIKENLTLHVQDEIGENFSLSLGSVAETVTVNASDLHINTTDAAVSTVVDRQFAENLPMNGRSFQTLIQLTPGVVLTVSAPNDGGQFSMNGQRASSNYWMVDGVSANFGVASAGPSGNGFSGALGASSAQGGTNSLVSVDALQEFRVQTSTYAPEFGRTPGGQISIVTRSGTNKFHGTVFDYFRNDVLDAKDWFANNKGLPKPQERQNDFGGTFSGPIFRDRTFFFFSYEGLRLRLPQVAETTVPSLTARQNAIPDLQPFLNAYPRPEASAPDINGASPFDASFSNRSTLDAYSLRIDHRVSDKLTLFGRYSYSPSELIQRAFTFSLSTVFASRVTTQTGTVGATFIVSPFTSDDFRFNYSRANALSRSSLDNFGGAVPLASLPLPSPFTSQDAGFFFDIFSLGQNGGSFVGANAHNLQQQFNIVNTLSLQRGRHSLKFGVDYRRLSPLFQPSQYVQDVFFFDVPSAETGSLFFDLITSANSARLGFRNLGIFAQDTWRVQPRVTLTYGLRWDVDFAPSTISGPSFPAVTGFDLTDLSSLALAPAGTPPFHTRYGNFAPRVGIAYQLSQHADWETVIRGGFGVFFDLATQEVGNSFLGSYPFGATKFNFFGSFPLDSATAAPPPITPASLGPPFGILGALDPNLELPYALEWNVALEQSLGKQQTLSASYIGSVGRRLIQTSFVFQPNPSFGQANLVTNGATSDYSALQLQFRRRMSRGLQALASYTWSHSIDTASAGSAFGNGANALVPAIATDLNRGPSDFDIRHAFSVAVTYELPGPKIHRSAKTILGGWSVQNVIQARSAPPVNVYNSIFFQGLSGAQTQVRPDVVAGQPLYLHGSQCAVLNGGQCPGGTGLNPSAFVDPPTTPAGCIPEVNFPCSPARQGNLGRNALRGFGAFQWDFAVHRTFPIHESIALQFRAEMFNVLNHPNFGQPLGDRFNPQFGQSTQMLGRSLGSGNNLGSGAFDPLYQIGGPRSIQFALKLQF